MSFVIDEKKLAAELQGAAQKLINTNREDAVKMLMELVGELARKYKMKLVLTFDPKDEA